MVIDKVELVCLLTTLIEEIEHDLKSEYFTDPKHISERKYLGFEQWAYERLIEEVGDSFPETSAFEIVENFCKRMNGFSCVNKKTSYMFSSAYDAGMNVYDLVIQSTFAD